MVVLASLSTLLVSIAIWLVTSESYGYDPQRSYDIAFADPQTRTLPGKIADWRLPVPASIDTTTETAILKVWVHSQLAGRFLAPEIVLSTPHLSQQITLEKGAQGCRYLPVDHRLAASEVIDIQTRRTDIDPRVEWIKFPKVRLGSGNILIIAPHPDDAEIASFGLYSQHPREVFIATITAGQEGARIFASFEADKERHAYLKGRARAWNSATTPLLANLRAAQLLSLGLFDGTLAQLNARPNETLAYGHRYKPSDFQVFNVEPIIEVSGIDNRWIDLVDALTRLLDRLQPSVIVTPHPDLDVHQDHVFATRAVIEALHRTSARLEGYFLLYTNHHLGNDAFPYGAAVTSTMIPPVTDIKVRVYNIQHVDIDREGIQRKIIALESMYDLRPSAYGLENQELWRSLKSVIKLQVATESYLRKAARTQEVFFGYPYEFFVRRD